MIVHEYFHIGTEIPPFHGSGFYGALPSSSLLSFFHFSFFFFETKGQQTHAKCIKTHENGCETPPHNPPPFVFFSFFSWRQRRPTELTPMKLPPPFLSAQKLGARLHCVGGPYINAKSPVIMDTHQEFGQLGCRYLLLSTS